MVSLLQNFAKTDCVHYEVKEFPHCCRRSQKAGVCTIGGKDRTCSLKMKWCEYEKVIPDTQTTEVL